MKDPKFNSFSRSLLTSMNVVALILSEIGILGYLTFGSSTKGNLINNYDSGSLLSDFMRVFVLMNVTFTYPLVCRPLVVASEYMLYNGKLMSWMTCGAAGNVCTMIMSSMNMMCMMCRTTRMMISHGVAASVISPSSRFSPHLPCRYASKICHFYWVSRVLLAVQAWDSSFRRLSISKLNLSRHKRDG